MWSYGQCMDNINQIISEINAMYKLIINLLTNDTLLQTATGAVPTLVEAIKGTSLTLCVMFFLINFFSKTLNLQWVTWENVMMLVLKCILAKVCVENAEFFTTVIYRGFNSFVSAVGDFSSNGLFVTDGIAIPIPEFPSFEEWCQVFHWEGWEGNTQSLYESLKTQYEQQMQNVSSTSISAAQYFVSAEDALKCASGYDAGFLNFSPIILNIFITIEGLIMKIIMILANVMVISRLFELTVYTLVAPIPLSTLACDGLSDVGKGFLKSYAAVTLQSLIIAIMFIAYGTVNSALFTLAAQNAEIPLNGWIGLITTITLGIGVMSSGSWAKRICGAT